MSSDDRSHSIRSHSVCRSVPGSAPNPLSDVLSDSVRSFPGCSSGSSDGGAHVLGPTSHGFSTLLPALSRGELASMRSGASRPGAVRFGSDPDDVPADGGVVDV
ncbi:hypothetical protein GCM10020218_067890 [Dactylosporangium vinaceum]